MKTTIRSGWKPAFDYVFFRKHERPRAISAGGVLMPSADNEHYCQAIAVGPGRPLVGGAVRKPPCEVGDLFLLNATITQGTVTEFLDDDGRLTYVVGGEYVLCFRSNAPPGSEDGPGIAAA